MCIDFTDLNKACPKDKFPLPRIDTLVDQAVGSKMLSFLDCFSRSKVYGWSLNLRRCVIPVLELKNCIILVFKLCLGLILIQTGMGPHVSFFSHLLSLVAATSSTMAAHLCGYCSLAHLCGSGGGAHPHDVAARSRASMLPPLATHLCGCIHGSHVRLCAYVPMCDGGSSAVPMCHQHNTTPRP
jgi:hypothetical protein